MKSLRSILTLVPVLLVGGLLGCSSTPTKIAGCHGQRPQIAGSVRLQRCKRQ